MKRLISILLIAVLFSGMIAFADENIVETYGGFEGNDVDATGYDWMEKLDLLLTLEFDSDTKWPEDELMPEGFKEADRMNIIHFGMNPGLGIEDLHEIGIDGRGVNIAYIDQPLDIKHNELINANIHYEGINNAKDTEGQNHGNGMSSILVGQNIGVVPRANLYFMGQPSWEGDQKNEADAVDRIIEINKTLPENEKIRVIGMSHGVSKDLKNWNELEKAKKRARAEGIMFIDVRTFRSIPLVIKPFLDKDNYKNFEITKKFNNVECKGLFVPTGGKIIANSKNHHGYFYQMNSGVSSTIPYIVGVVTMGFQVAPDLTIEDAEKFLWESASRHENKIIINPTGFLDMVIDKYGSPYTAVLYNSKKLNQEDILALNDLERLIENKYNKISFIDNKGRTDFEHQYKLLQELISKEKGRLMGVQIIGTKDAVSSFSIKDKVLMKSGNFHTGGTVYTDYFYGNQNTIEDLNEFKNIADLFAEKEQSISFVQQWPVARVLITRGKLKNYINKYENYKKELKNQGNSRLVNFSSPIFSSSDSVDDFSTFIKNKLINKGKVINGETVELYGNKLGDYPVSHATDGDFSKSSLKKTNENGIVDITINSHGQPDNIDGVYFKDEEEFRYSLVNSSNINQVLSGNPYTLYLWNCWGAANLDDSLSKLVINKGNAVAVMANSYLGFNNGIDNSVAIKELVNNNSFLMYYMYNYYYRYCNFSHCQSYYYAKKDYLSSVLKNNTIEDNDIGNYQFQLTNILGHHFIGLLDMNKSVRDYKRTIDIDEDIKSIITPFSNEAKFVENSGEEAVGESKNQDNIEHMNDENEISKIPVINKIQNEFVVFKDDEFEYEEIQYRDDLSNENFKVNSVAAAMDNGNVYIKVKYDSPSESNILIFLQGDTPGLKEMYRSATKVGDNIIIVKFNKETLKSYKEGLAINLGGRNFIFIDQKITDKIADIQIKEEI